jgi:hypothetical protein
VSHKTIADPCEVNKFDDEAKAVEHARHWSKTWPGEWSVIYAPSSTGLAYFVVRDAGMIMANETLVRAYEKGKRVDEGGGA